MSIGIAANAAAGLAIFLTEDEIALLENFAQIPFLPAVRRHVSGEIIVPGIATGDGVLQSLESKGILSIDTDIPLDGFDYSEFEKDFDLGSAALTAVGAEAVESLDISGIN